MKKILLAFFLAFAFISVQAKDWVILEPSGDFSPAYHHAATEFQKFYKAVTGSELKITATPADGTSMVVIGSDMVNGFVRSSIESGLIKPLDLGADSDAYRILSVSKGDCQYLFLAGGCGRSTLYAVYDFFERQAGCRYFWDGDIIPKSKDIEMTGLDIREEPRFEYRGLRYFGHRSLTRFQAEHWGPKEWEQEIDWIVKKRMNIFMLRFGMDDVFQKAFPDIVPYPPTDDVLPGIISRSYCDRTTAWPLQYRGQLRKHILQYARERELIHPEDMGTMTHWYSPTPKEFLDKVKPELVGQTQRTSAYKHNPTFGVWDIRDDRNLDYYWRLTETHIKEYGSPQMFHTIGFAERSLYEERDKNLELKLYAYRRTITKLREKYPTAPLLIGGWDLYNPGWTREETEAMLKQMNPDNTLILDYTSDLPKGDFRQWVPRGRFPYIFGVLHAYEWENELRGNYGLLAERFPSAIEDPMCKGFVFWPEQSHSDILMLQYLTHNSWSPDMLTPEENITALCRDRYGEFAEVMEKAWKAALPFILLSGELPPVWRRITSLAVIEPNEDVYERYCRSLANTETQREGAAQIWRILSAVPYGQGNAFVDRDVIDLARTVAGRLLTAEIYRYITAQRDWKDGKCSRSDVKKAGARAMKTFSYLRDILSLHDDYSLIATWKQTESVYSPLNPVFENTLKGNAENSYCRTYIRELFDYYFLPEFERYMSYVNKRLSGKETGERSMQDIIEAFYAKPLQEMTSLSTCQRTGKDYGKLMNAIALLYQE